MKTEHVKIISLSIALLFFVLPLKAFAGQKSLRDSYLIAEKNNADNNFIVNYKYLRIYMEMSNKTRKNEPHVVILKLSNPVHSMKVGYYVVEAESDEGPLLPMSFEIRNLETGEMSKTQRPSPLLFKSGLAIYERPRTKKGKPLSPGEEISSKIDIQKHLATLKAGDYEVTPVIWLPPGVPVKSDKAYPLSILEE